MYKLVLLIEFRSEKRYCSDRSVWSDRRDDLPSGVMLPLPLPLVVTVTEALLLVPLADIEVALLEVQTTLGPPTGPEEVDPLVDAVLLLFEFGPLPTLDTEPTGGEEEDGLLLLLLFDGIREF